MTSDPEQLLLQAGFKKRNKRSKLVNSNPINRTYCDIYEIIIPGRKIVVTVQTTQEVSLQEEGERDSNKIHHDTKKGSPSTFLHFCLSHKLVANQKLGSSYKGLEAILAFSALNNRFLNNHFYSFYLIKQQSEKEINYLEDSLARGYFLQETFSFFLEGTLLEGIFHAYFLRHLFFREEHFIYPPPSIPLFRSSRFFSLQEVCS